MAVNKVLTANGSKGHHRFTLTVNEDSTSGNSSFLSYSFTISPIQTGWDWYQWGSMISFSVTIGSNTYTGTIPAYGGYSTDVLSSNSNIEIQHDSDGTKTINVSFSVSDTTGAYYTSGNASASDTMTLTVLHKAPQIINLNWTENNQQLVQLFSEYYDPPVLVQYLSDFTFTYAVKVYDNATNPVVKFYHNNILIGTGNNLGSITYDNYVLYNGTARINFYDVGELKIDFPRARIDVTATDSLNSTGSTYTLPMAIDYTKPTLITNTSKIARFTGYSSDLQQDVALTDNKALLTTIGTYYNASGFSSNRAVISHKVWERNDTEPASYTSDSTITTQDGQINYSKLISNINYLKVYKYKIKVEDAFTTPNATPTSFIIEGEISTGVPVWSEYKDHVDFLKLTVGGYNPFEYNEDSEIIVGLYDNGVNQVPIYRKTIKTTTPSNINSWSTVDNVNNLDILINIYGSVVGSDGRRVAINHPEPNYEISTTIKNNNVEMKLSNSIFENLNCYIIVEYTKTTN